MKNLNSTIRQPRESRRHQNSTSQTRTTQARLEEAENRGGRMEEKRRRFSLRASAGGSDRRCPPTGDSEKPKALAHQPPPASSLVILHQLLVAGCLLQGVLIVSGISSTSTSATSVASNVSHVDAKSLIQQQQQKFNLDCQPGEQRNFDYESATRVWGSAEQQVRMLASIRVRCLESSSNRTLKYLVEVLELNAKFGAADSSEKSNGRKGRKRRKKSRARVFSQRDQTMNNNRCKGRPADCEDARAEPVFEEVGEVLSETASRVKRSVSGWFSRAWGSVKDFFVGMFNAGEKSTVGREEALEDGGIDIAGQCKVHRDKTHATGESGPPVDDSAFDDLEPKYNMGASSFGDAAFEFAGEEREAVDQLSFFDDPKSARTKRAMATGAGAGGRKTTTTSKLEAADLERLVRLPFVFTQTRKGTIRDVRFSGEETDASVRNFKRHICDLFATNLERNKTELSEVSPLGRHETQYLVDGSSDSAEIRERLVKELPKAPTPPGGDLEFVKAVEKAAAAVAAVAMQSTSSGGGGDSSSSRDAGGRPGDANLSVLRSINSTGGVQVSAKAASLSAITWDQIQVRVKQVQQISEGRLTGISGRLGVSLVQSAEGRGAGASRDSGARNHHLRSRRSSAGGRDAENASEEEEENDGGGGGEHLMDEQDVAELLQVSSSYSLQLVAAAEEPDRWWADDPTSDKPMATPTGAVGEFAAQLNRRGRSKRSDNKQVDDARDGARDSGGEHDEKKQHVAVSSSPGGGGQSRRASQLVVRPPADSQHLLKLLQEWRRLESELDLSSASLRSESEAADTNSQLGERLEILRNQIQLRLNEEFTRNRLRRKVGDSLRDAQVARLSASSSSSSKSSKSSASSVAGEEEDARRKKQQSNDLGLGLTQLILGNGITGRRKGSIYATIEETLELETELLGVDGDDHSVSRLLRETARVDKLREHCRSAIASADELAQSEQSRVELRYPFGLASGDAKASSGQKPPSSRDSSSSSSSLVHLKNKRLEECKQVARLLLKVGERQVGSLVVELIDECNRRMLASAKNEELGYGPASRYYRQVRQQFTELLAHLSRPADSLIDKLMSRLSLRSSSLPAANKPKQTAGRKIVGAGGNNNHHHHQQQELPEFVYVDPKTQVDSSSSEWYNRSLLNELDDFNNSDGVGSLLMTITSLAARPSVSAGKRGQVVDELLASLKASSCSTFASSDLDVLESLGTLRHLAAPAGDEGKLAARLVLMARRCRDHEQYVVACVHGLAGQLGLRATQRFFAEQLSAPEVSCTVKSEIVAALVSSFFAADATSPVYESGSIGQAGPHLWPLVGSNQVDDVLADILKADDTFDVSRSRRDQQGGRISDRKCLGSLISRYFALKRRAKTTGGDLARATSTQNPQAVGAGGKNQRRSQSGVNRSRGKRAASAPTFTAASSASSSSNLTENEKTTPAQVDDLVAQPPANNSSSNDFWDESDCKRWSLDMDAAEKDEKDESDVDLPSALSGSRNSTRSPARLIERESDLRPLASAGSSRNASADAQALRKRHKCWGRKSYGPKNAQAVLNAEVVNELVGARGENKFLARFRLATKFLGSDVDVGRMYLWHQRRVTRAYANVLGKSLWDTSHTCRDRAPNHLVYLPLMDFNLWLVKVSLGLKLQTEMGFFSNCDHFKQHQQQQQQQHRKSARVAKLSDDANELVDELGDELELYPTITLRAAGEATAKFVVARTGMSLAGQYGYQGSIRVSRQPDSCMSIRSGHQPLNVTLSSWVQLWDNECRYWGSRSSARPQATRWRLGARRPSVWLADECLGARSDSAASA